MPKTRQKHKTPKKPPTTTAVPDRSAIPLGDEARMVTRMLAAYGAQPDHVPRIGTDPLAEWEAYRQPTTVAVPRWLLDWTCALLRLIPERVEKRPGAKGDPAVDAALETARRFDLPKAVAARHIASAEASRRHREEAQRRIRTAERRGQERGGSDVEMQRYLIKEFDRIIKELDDAVLADAKEHARRIRRAMNPSRRSTKSSE